MLKIKVLLYSLSAISCSFLFQNCRQTTRQLEASVYWANNHGYVAPEESPNFTELMVIKISVYLIYISLNFAGLYLFMHTYSSPIWQNTFFPQGISIHSSDITSSDNSDMRHIFEPARTGRFLNSSFRPTRTAPEAPTIDLSVISRDDDENVNQLNNLLFFFHNFSFQRLSI